MICFDFLTLKIFEDKINMAIYNQEETNERTRKSHNKR